MYLLMYLDYILSFFFFLFKSFLPLLASESHFFFSFREVLVIQVDCVSSLGYVTWAWLDTIVYIYILHMSFVLISLFFFLKNILLKVSQLTMEQSKFDANLSNQPQLLVKHLKYIGQDRTLRSYFCHYIKK